MKDILQTERWNHRVLECAAMLDELSLSDACASAAANQDGERDFRFEAAPPYA